MSKRVLLAAQASVGHTNGLRAIGRALRASGHEVAFALPVVRAPDWSVVPEPVRTSAALPDAIRADGFELIGLRPALASIWHGLLLPSSSSYDELGHALGLFMAGMEDHARRIAAAAEAFGANVIAGDYLFFAAWLGALLSRRPFAAFYHSRRVYVSLGTVFNGKPEVFERILRELDRPGVQVIVSGGASTDRLERRPPSANAHVFRRVPQLAVLERVDLVVTHGGNNTVQETLAAGRPMLVIPFGGDQLENARRVERLGVGIALVGTPLSPGELHLAVERLLGEPGFAARAAGLVPALRGVDGTRRAAEAISSLGTAGPGALA